MRILIAALAALTLALVASPGSHAQQGSIEFRGLLVRLRPVSAVASSDEAIAQVVKSVFQNGWTATATDLDGEYRLVPRAAAHAPRSAASAWAAVHRLHATGLLVRAEPLLQGPLPAAPHAPLWPGECTPGWSGTASASHDDGALTDSTWSLGPRGANVIAAGVRGSGGRDVVIGHPDTGYLNHPSINGALLGRGFDFTGRVSIALDTADDGRLQWPGHGTRTSSVIAGRPFALSKYVIRGVAPEARIMPLKVAHRVVLFDRIDTDMDNVARAIRAAAIGDQNFVRQRAEVISMSLGGAPSKAVEEALALAEEQNLIVLAAAGNQVPRREVVFPARYGNVIAVAASNYDSSNWEYSSKGSAVAVAAPGQNVWTARVRRVNGTTHFCIEPSSGTSYAVATTAGIAALWLSHHRDALRSRPDLDLARTFRALVSCTARTIDVPEDEQPLYGGGIVDTRALLEEPLPAPDGPAEGQSEKCSQAVILLPPRRLVRLDRCDNLTALTALVGRRRTGEALLFGEKAPPDACSLAGHLGDEIASLFAREPAATTAVHLFLQDRSSGALMRLRHEIRRLDISPQLRRQLIAADCAGPVDRSCT